MGSMPVQDGRPYPIIDSHVHLWPASEMKNLNMYSPNGPFNTQQSLNEYIKATGSTPHLQGFVFVEVDRKYDLKASNLPGSGWDGPLQEIRFLRRIAIGHPKQGEGHLPEDARLCLGIIPWAPVTSGVRVMEKYLGIARQAAGEAWPKIKGFRYLLQDKPDGTMLDVNLIESLKLLGRKGFVFEVAADHSRRGDIQLDEVLAMVKQVHYDIPENERVTLIIDHMCKPDLDIVNPTADPSFQVWHDAMSQLSRSPQVYIKLSGGLTQMSEQHRSDEPEQIFHSIKTWLRVLLELFGPSRIIFGSDWPVCTLGNEGKDSWGKWHGIVDLMCREFALEDGACEMIFGGAAKKAYGL